MTDIEPITPVEPPAEGTTPNGSNPAPSHDTKPPATVPYERLQEVISKNKALEQSLTEFKTKAQTEAEELARKNGEFEKLYNDNLPKIQEHEELLATVNNILEAELKNIPEDRLKLIPEGFTAKQKLDYIAANRDILVQAKSTTNKPIKQGEQEEGKVYHKASDIDKPEYYEQHRDDIIKAANEGRIID